MQNIKLDGRLTMRFWHEWKDLIEPSLGRRPDVYLADFDGEAYGCFDLHLPGTFGYSRNERDIFLSRSMLNGTNEFSESPYLDRLKFLSDVYLHECVHVIHYKKPWHRYSRRGHCQDFAMLANYYGKQIGLPPAVTQDDIEGWPNTVRPHGYYGTIVRRESVFP